MGEASIYTLENHELLISVNAFGAELCSVTSKQNNLEYIWQADKDIWPRHAPVLFPTVGKLKNHTYTYHGRSYTLSQHGFARDSHFTCTEQSAGLLVFELQGSEQTLKIFPFQFRLRITYLLEQDQLTISYQVFNPSADDLYFSIGAHPGFNCPLQAGESFEDYRLEFPGKDQIICNKLSDGLLTGETYALPLQDHALKVSYGLFSNDALVLTGSQVDEIRLVSKTSGHGVAMQCKGWPYFGIWAKKNTERFVCLEPWQGIADDVAASGDLSSKQGIICLSVGKEFACHYTTRFF